MLGRAPQMRRLQLALAGIVLVIGILGSVLFLPVEVCSNLGFRGTKSENTRCEFDSYYFVADTPPLNKGRYQQHRIDHVRMTLQLGFIFFLFGLMAIDYRKLLKRLS